MAPSAWQRIKTASVRGFHAYANWLVGISWKRFIVLSVLLMILSGVLQNLPPFSWSYTRVVHLPAEDAERPALDRQGRTDRVGAGDPAAMAEAAADLCQLDERHVS